MLGWGNITPFFLVRDWDSLPDVAGGLDSRRAQIFGRLQEVVGSIPDELRKKNLSATVYSTVAFIYRLREVVGSIPDELRKKKYSTEKEYSDNLHIKCIRGGSFPELLLVKLKLPGGRGIDSRRAQKKLLYSTAVFV